MEVSIRIRTVPHQNPENQAALVFEYFSQDFESKNEIMDFKLR
jgi:hypothetical protein